MPLTTNMGFTTSPDIWIKVSDGGGGGGNDHTVDLTVTFDTAALHYVSGSDGCTELGAGVCGWFDVKCPADGRTFTAEFTRLNNQRTYLTGVAVDHDAGEVDSTQLRLGLYTSLSGSVKKTKKKKKKAKKKA